MPGDGSIPLFGDSFWGPKLSEAVLNASLPVDRLNDMVRPLICAQFQALMMIGHSNRRNMVQARTRQGLPAPQLLQQHRKRKGTFISRRCPLAQRRREQVH